MKKTLTFAAICGLASGALAQQSADPSFVPGLTPTAAPLSISSRATTACDDFNRATGLGSDWTPLGGAPTIINDRFGDASGANAYAQHTTAAASVGSQVITIDLPDTPPTGTYGAAVHGLGGSTNLYTKVQSGGGTTYTNIGFYSGFNGASYGSGFSAITAISGGWATMYLTNGDDTMNVDFDTDRDGVIDVSYTSTGALAYSATAGTGCGVGSWGGFNAGNAGSVDLWELNGGCSPSGPVLTLTCGGGSATAAMANLTGGGVVAVVYGPAGAYVHGGATCNGTMLDLIPANSPLLLSADAAGNASVTRPVGGAACGSGILVQGVDVSTCVPTNSAAL